MALTCDLSTSETDAEESPMHLISLTNLFLVTGKACLQTKWSSEPQVHPPIFARSSALGDLSQLTEVCSAAGDKYRVYNLPAIIMHEFNTLVPFPVFKLVKPHLSS